jgi:hypothetical protein
VVNYALKFDIFTSVAASSFSSTLLALRFASVALRANDRCPSRCKCRRKRRSFCRVQTALRAILMPSCVAAGLDIGICMTSSRHCSSLRKSNSVSRSQGFGSLSGSGPSSGSGLAFARFGSLTFVFHQAISSGVRSSCDGLRSGRPRRRVGSGYCFMPSSFLGDAASRSVHPWMSPGVDEPVGTLYPNLIARIAVPSGWCQ